MSITTAAKIQPGDVFTDEMGHKHTAVRVEAAPGGAGVYVYVAGGQGYPEFYAWAHVVTLHSRRRPQPADPKPFKVYTRDYNAKGDADKRIHSFKTRAQQAAFVRRTNRCVTFCN